MTRKLSLEYGVTIKEFAKHRKQLSFKIANQIIEHLYNHGNIEDLANFEDFLSRLEQQVCSAEETQHIKGNVNAVLSLSLDEYTRLRDSGMTHQQVKQHYSGNPRTLLGYARWYPPKKKILNLIDYRKLKDEGKSDKEILKNFRVKSKYTLGALKSHYSRKKEKQK